MSLKLALYIRRFDNSIKDNKMSKWIDERAWTMSVYICYALGFIVLSVAGYNCAISLVGDVSLFMRIIILMCVCLLVALIVLLAFSAFITPLSELILRMLKRLQQSKIVDVPVPVNEEKGGDEAVIGGESTVSPSKKPDKNTLRSLFMSRYVADNHKNEPIYDVIDHVLNERKEGAFAAKIIISAHQHFQWLTSMPSGQVMASFFGEETIKSTSAYDTGKSANKDVSDNEANTILKASLEVFMKKKLEEAKANAKK